MRKQLMAAALICAGFGGAMEGRSPAVAAPVQDPVDRIAYDHCYPTAAVGYYCDLRVIAGGPETVLATGQGTWAPPNWSPDGSRIAVAFNMAADIFVVDVATGIATNLTNGPARDFLPAWSPDGAQIAFVRAEAASYELHVMNADGSNSRRLTFSSGFVGWFSWSPRGNVIAFGGRDSAGAHALYVVNADGSNTTYLTGATGFTGALAWSPDGTRLVFDCVVEAGNADVCAIAPDGTNFARLTSDPAWEGRGAIAPRDSRLAFLTTQFGPDAEIAVMASDGTLTRVAVGTAAMAPKWSPDGTRLIFTGAIATGWAGTPCYFVGEGDGHNADDICEPAYEIHIANADGTGVTAMATGNTAHWFAPKPIASFVSQCAASVCDFDGGSSSYPTASIVGYAWDFGDGTSAAGQTVTHAYAGTGTYDVTLTVTGSDGTTSSGTRTVTPGNTTPVASFTLSCAIRTCNVDASGSTDADGSIASYSWGFGDGSIASGVTAAHTYVPGSYTIWLRVTDDAGGAAATSQTATIVNIPPVAAFTYVCTGLICTMDGSSSRDADGTLKTYVWAFGDRNTFVGVKAGHSYLEPGTYAISLWVTDNEGASHNATQTVTIARPEMHIGDVDAAIQKQPGGWTPLVTITLHDSNHAPIFNAMVTGVWSTGVTATCSTSQIGTCAVGLGPLPNKTASVTFSVQSVTEGRFAYTAAANHDPDGDSNGTTITVKKQ
jgi:PKD repeat protein